MPIRCPSCRQDNRDGSRFCLQCGSSLDEEPVGDALIGRMIQHRYRIEKVLGEGGMGRVYLAHQQMGTATRDVAVKILHGTYSRDEPVRTRFYRECEVVIGLSHPNTIQFHDFGELEDGRLYIVMEYIEGQSLAQLLTGGAIPADLVERMLDQIAGSLGEAHDRGIVHRDLKPENILLTVRGGEPDFVKVCDFGIAKRQDDAGGDAGPALTLQGTVIGTPQYMSPEQLSGGTVDARSDIYSLGLIVYEMLAGQRPFTANSPLEWAARHTAAEPPPLTELEVTRHLPRYRVDAVMSALAKLPVERPTSARAFASAFAGREHASTPAMVPLHGASRAGVNVDGTAPTLMASPAAARRLHADDEEVLRPAGLRGPTSAPSSLVFIAVALLGAGAVVAGWQAFQHREVFGFGSGDGAEVPAPGAADAGPGDPPPPPAPTEWIRVVHQERNIDDAAHALGPPDGRYAVIRPSGTITLELAAGTRIVSDEDTGPDVFIQIDDERSAAYRADVGVDRNQYTTVGSVIQGSLPLDSDQFGITRIRYVRIKNRGSTNVYLDAVGAYRTATTGS